MGQERPPAKALALDTLSIFSGKDEQFAFKRALSRLLEMSSEEYARDEPWAPLPPSSRKWESSDNGILQTPPDTSPFPSTLQSGPMPQYQAVARNPFSTHVPTDSPDFAEEAHLSPSSRATDRPSAPRLSADHVWGVREDWGERARQWGRGAAAYAPTPLTPPTSSPAKPPPPPRPSLPSSPPNAAHLEYKRQHGQDK